MTGGWRGQFADYQAIAPGVAGGGGNKGTSDSDVAPGDGGSGGPGPGALIGLR